MSKNHKHDLVRCSWKYKKEMFLLSFAIKDVMEMNTKLNYESMWMLHCRQCFGLVSKLRRFEFFSLPTHNIALV